MQQKKHSKYKNSGILFEVLVKKITSEILSGKESPAILILKKYFRNSELGKEYKLYESLFKNKTLNESQSHIILETLLKASEKINREKLKQEKYNLIKELKQHYNIEELFKTKLSHYKAQAAFYILLEIHNSSETFNPTQIIENKITLLEAITEGGKVNSQEIKEDVLDDFRKSDKDLRTLTYYVLLEKFNSKYNNLSSKQKHLLKEYITSVDNTLYLKEYYNKEIHSLKKEISKHAELIVDPTTKIKLLEVNKLITPLDKTTHLRNEHLIDLLQYYSLLEEIQGAILNV